MGVFKKIFKSDDAAPSDKHLDARPSQPAPKVADTSKKVLKEILLHPIITEKSSSLQSQNQYVFAVKSGANKISIARAIENVYGVKPSAVRVSWVTGKTRVRGRRRGQTADWKKAVIALPAGKSITVAEGV